MNHNFINKWSFFFITILTISLLFTRTAWGQEITPPVPVSPAFEAEERVQSNSNDNNLTLVERNVLLSLSEPFQAGGDRLANLQNNDGGWDWPLDNGNPATGSALNTIGPIGMGLAQAYKYTNDPSHLTALQQTGAFLLTKTNNFSPPDGYLAAQLDIVFGGTTYTDHVKTNFYDQLAAGTYNYKGLGTLYDTAGYVNRIHTSRSAIPNLAAWDVGMGLVGAASAGADTTAWIAGVKAEIDDLDGSDSYDVIGLAGAVYGLAFVSEDYDPTTGEHASASSLADLAAILATYQINSSGGFTWNSAYVAAGEEVAQETSYAILALSEFDSSTYYIQIQGATNYLRNAQLPTGGWENYPGNGENNELTAEALWAISILQCATDCYVDTATGDDANGGTSWTDAKKTIQAAIDQVDVGGTVHVAVGTYNESVVIDKRISLIGSGSGTGDTIVTAVGGLFGVVQLEASGLSAIEPLRLKDLRIAPNGRSGISVGQFNQSTGKNVSYIELDNVWVVGTNVNPCSEQERGLYVDKTSSLSYVIIKNSAFDNLHYGWYFHKEVSADASSVHHATVENSTFNHNNFKGIYAEKLSDATFTSITVNANGFVGALPTASACEFFRPWMSGVDINLKAGTYQNITFTDSSIFSDNGLDGAINGVGIAIKARDTGSYTSFPASLTGVLVDDSTLSSNKAGIRFGEPTQGNTGPLNARVQNVAFSDNADYSVNNQSLATVTVAGNQFSNENIVFVKSAGGGLLAYANNILSFNNAGLTSMAAGTFNGRHNWWGTYVSQPVGVDNDSWAYLLGAAVGTWADGTGTVTLADSIAADNASFAGNGRLVIVNHGNGIPFGKGIPADTGAFQCADFYDFFAIGGSGSYDVSIPVDGTNCTSGDIDNKLFEFALNGSGEPDLTCAPDSACWNSIAATRIGDVLTANVAIADLQGTPFAAPSSNNNDPTAVSLSTFSAPANRGGLSVTVILLLVILTGLTLWKRQINDTSSVDTL